jgi:hypothetical protein
MENQTDKEYNVNLKAAFPKAEVLGKSLKLPVLPETKFLCSPGFEIVNLYD